MQTITEAEERILTLYGKLPLRLRDRVLSIIIQWQREVAEHG